MNILKWNGSSTTGKSTQSSRSCSETKNKTMNAKSMLPKLESLQARKKKNWNSDGRSTTLEP